MNDTPRNMASELARYAFECATKAQYEDKYPQYVKKMPAMIRNSGYAKAFAFGYSKDEKLYEWIYSDIIDWLFKQNLLEEGEGAKTKEDLEKIKEYKDLKCNIGKLETPKKEKKEFTQEDEKKLKDLKDELKGCKSKIEDLQHRMIENVIRKFIGMDYAKYRRCENETMAFLDWLRRFAEGMNPEAVSDSSEEQEAL